MTPYRYSVPQPAEWETVLGLVQTFEDALALMGLYEEAGGNLFANHLHRDAIVDDGALTHRGFADLLAGILIDRTGREYDYDDLYMGSRDDHPSRETMDAFAARCLAAGVVLTAGETPPPPWQVVVDQIASAADVRVLALIASDPTWYANDMRLADHREIYGALEIPPCDADERPSADEQASFVARCRAAGVIVAHRVAPC